MSSSTVEWNGCHEVRNTLLARLSVRLTSYEIMTINCDHGKVLHKANIIILER